MKKIITLSVVHMACMLYSVTAQTNVSGFINANTTWNIAGSPYIIVGNALLSHGYTLTIDPGVTIKFNSSTTLQIDGELHAIGTAANRITFTSNQSLPAAGDWERIHFADTCKDAVFDANGNYLTGCIMKFCDVMYGGQNGPGSIHNAGSRPYFSRCRILNSSTAGIEGDRAYVIDSSAIKNCGFWGLRFGFAGGLVMRADTLENNWGGIHFSTASNVNISNNVFYMNHDATCIMVQGALTNVVIRGNDFINNTCGNIIGISDIGNDTIECNRFIDNQSTLDLVGIGYVNGTSVFRNNIFTDNTSTQGGSAVIDVSAFDNAASFRFTNNVLRNNTSLTGNCCEFSPQMGTNQSLVMRNNEFSNNTAPNVIYIDGYQTGNSNFNIVEMKFNNFMNPVSIHELYNNVPYGSPNLYVDSNYWGTASIAHVDSAIYDYFDFSSQSVVYYTPVLSAFAVMDTTCLSSVINSVNSFTPVYSNMSFYPNPFSVTATISFGSDVRNATFSLYNLLGEKVKTISGINGRSLQIHRENLQSGMYIFEVTEETNRIGGGKAIIY